MARWLSALLIGAGFVLIAVCVGAFLLPEEEAGTLEIRDPARDLSGIVVGRETSVTFRLENRTTRSVAIVGYDPC